MNKFGVLVSLWNRLNRRNMEITRHNFAARREEILEAVETCHFLSIDGEFTGLNAYRGISPYDLPFQRYDKVQESARQFLLVQFGLCTFHYNPDTDKFTNQAYNFYVWPRPCSRQAPDPRFLCQTTSLDFLINQGFDFNKLLKDGMSYLRPGELDKLKNSARERQEYRRLSTTPNNDQNIAIPPEQETFLAETHAKLEKFLQSEEQSLELSRCNAFQRRLIYQTAREKYTNLSLSSLTKTGGERVIAVVKADETEQRRLVEQKDQSEMLDLDQAFGFSEVIKKISDSQKLMVGHNMLLDVCHTLNQFCGPLPETYTDFKHMTNTVFPAIIDTKLMANTIPFKDEIFNSALEELMKTVSASPYSLPDISPRKSGSGYSLSCEKYHEAGYDAFVTGLCFISMARRLAKLTGSKEKGVDASSAHIKPFLNKLYLMKIVDIPYMNLAGDDLKPDRKHVFHLTFPADWKTTDIVFLFSAFGNVTVVWINDTSAFVALRDRTGADKVQEVLVSSSQCRVLTYDEHLAQAQLTDNTSLPSSSSGSLQTPKSLPRFGLHTTDSLLSPLRSAGTSGITPVLEKSFSAVTALGEAAAAASAASAAATAGQNGSGNKKKEKKRPVSPDSMHDLKRSRSVTEDKDKEFEEPPWE